MGNNNNTMSAPELNLSAVTLYKNNLGFFERTAAMEEGETSASGEKVFSVHVPLDRKGMIVDTLTAAEDATIKYDSIDEAATRSGIEEDAYGFTLSHIDGLGGFLSSCPGAEVKVECGPIDGEPACSLEGKLLMLEKDESVLCGQSQRVDVLVSDRDAKRCGGCRDGGRRGRVAKCGHPAGAGLRQEHLLGRLE